MLAHLLKITHVFQEGLVECDFLLLDGFKRALKPHDVCSDLLGDKVSMLQGPVYSCNHNLLIVCNPVLQFLLVQLGETSKHHALNGLSSDSSQR